MGNMCEIQGFYRVYHSMRYVKGELVLRLQKELAPALVERLRSDFVDLVEKGTINPTGPLPSEENEPHLKDYPRLRFWFDRRSLGRLRQMIDAINREG